MIYESPNHLLYMEKALEQAQYAYAQDEVPIGAVVVDEKGEVIGQGYNQVESSSTQAAHAEFLAITAAGQRKGDWRLNGCWLYVTLEPCRMCMNLILLSRLEGVVFGASSPLFGHSLIDNELSSSVYKKDALVMMSGIKNEECSALLKQFFKDKRG